MLTTEDGNIDSNSIQLTCACHATDSSCKISILNFIRGILQDA